MENASKALLIAGGVLIAILLLTLFSYLFTQMSTSTSNIYKNLYASEVAEFNQKFINYEGRGIYAREITNDDGTKENVYDYLTYQDIATLINLAKDSEENSTFKAEVKIMVDGTNVADKDLKDWLKEAQGDGTKKEYICEKVNINSETALVDEVVIKTKR